MEYKDILQNIEYLAVILMFVGAIRSTVRGLFSKRPGTISIVLMGIGLGIFFGAFFGISEFGSVVKKGTWFLVSVVLICFVVSVYSKGGKQ